MRLRINEVRDDPFFYFHALVAPWVGSFKEEECSLDVTFGDVIALTWGAGEFTIKDVLYEVQAGNPPGSNCLRMIGDYYIVNAITREIPCEVTKPNDDGQEE